MCPFGFAANAKSRLRGVCAIIERRKFRGASVPPFVKGLARMPRFMPNATLVFSGLGYAADGPYLLVNDVYGKKQMRLPVLGRTFTLRHTQKRFCIGPFDLKTYQSKACENSVELMPSSQYKDDMCPAHFVYMAYFSPQHLKVGISSETRGIERLLEQGARVAGILKRFANADEARALEAHLCAQEGIYETMRLGTKVRLLSDPFKADAAIETVYEAARAHGVEPEGGVLDLTKYYFGDVEAAPDIVQLPDDSPSDMVAGRCVGMVGGILMLEQGGNVFAAPVKEWESYEVEITVGELLCEYEYEPQQMGLF